MKNVLNVYLREDLAGSLWLDEGRRFVFQYDPAWLYGGKAMPLSFSLPLQEATYHDDQSRPFFANLLPEAEIRRMIARRLRISAANDFDMLRAIGGECAGAVSLLREGLQSVEKPGYRELNENELQTMISELPGKPFLVGEKGIRLSLAGAQNKLPVYMEDTRIFIPTGNAPSTHILKPPIPGLAGTVENETFCMMLAARMGLNVPAAVMRRGTESLYVVERYDRWRDAEGHVVRLHQEDFCQALGMLPDQKYEGEGGPSLATCFSLLKKSASPAADQKALLSWVIFNVLIGNADAHAKNLSILYTVKGPRIAPFYDLLCVEIYPGLTGRLAMKIGGENRSSWLQARHWERLGSETGVKIRLIRQLMTAMAPKIIPAAAATVLDFSNLYGESEVIVEIGDFIRKRAAMMMSASRKS